MIFVVKCIEDYITDSNETLFVKGELYTLKIDEDAEARVLYDGENGTLFLEGSLERHFEQYMY